MDLLSSSESHAFQSFLSSIDIDYSLQDTLTSTEWSFLNDEIPIPHTQPGKEALEKATKDLMALQPQASLQASAWSLAPFQSLSPFKQQPRSLRTVPPIHPSAPPATTVQSTPTSAFAPPAPARRSPSLVQSPTAFTAPNSLVRPRPTRDPSASSSASTSTPSPSLSTKRSHSQDSDPAKRTAKRQRTSSSARSPKAPSSSSSASASGTPQSALSGKPALLTASQKKANHIQSEQKRRANIRRGYEALCETVPTLREAIRAEDEANAAAAAAGASVSSAGSKKRKTRTKSSDDGEKIDGRAGPRSENIVLQKTIDFIQELRAEREGLLARLQRGRGALARGHPALMPAREGLPLVGARVDGDGGK
ncbi:hypothetical protein EVG20_g7206 [Dentipellis fragilis]|uniref:BHLH domain-containing protein n=1 Tax=Dentipellis fragilis TaxID=205917 RepID=A0A4Y9YFA9_9AGAM|nr:hypothetical protein EVG20_g7206 [Dentipellis fragilis]